VDEFNIDIKGDEEPPPEFNIDIPADTPEFKIDLGPYGEPTTQPEAGVDWPQAIETGKTKVLPAALQIGTGFATSGMSIPAQIGANVLAGGVGRYLGGGDPLAAGGPIPFKDESGWLQDALFPAAPLIANTAIGAAKGLAKPMMKTLYPDIAEATKGITKWFPDLPEVKLTDVTARPIAEKTKARATVDWFRDVLGSPVELGKGAASEELPQVAQRLDLFPRARNQFSQYIQNAEQDIFSTPAEGLLGKLGRRVEMPQADREDVKLLMEGHKTADEVAPHVVEAAGQLRNFYDNFASLGKRFGLLNKDAPEILNYSGPNIFRHGMGEDVSSLAEETAMDQARRRAMGFKARDLPFDPLVHVTDARELLRSYGKAAPEKFAGAYTFGPRAASTSEGTNEFGVYANELLNRASAKGLSPNDRQRAESMIGSLKNIYHAGEPTKATGLAQAISTPLLALSGLRQFKQAAWNVARPGWQNTVEGVVRYLKDPDFRALIDAGGGRAGSLTHLFKEMGSDESLLGSFAKAGARRLPSSVGGPIGRGIERVQSSPLLSRLPSNLVGSTIGGAESMLRGPLAAGYIPQMEDVLSRAARGESSRGLSRQLAEAGLDIKNLPPTSAALLRDVQPTLTGRYQLMSGDPGQSSSKLLGSEFGRLAGMFQNFPLGAARLFKNDVLAPIGSGLKNRDMSELALGLGRATRLAPAGLASAAAVRAVSNLAQGKSPADWAYSDVAHDAAGTILGKPADIYSAVTSAKDPTTGGVDLPAGVLRAILSQRAPIMNLNPNWGQLGLLGANALSPQLGSALSLAGPAAKEYLRDKGTPLEQFHRMQRQNSPYLQYQHQQAAARQQSGR